MIKVTSKRNFSSKHSSKPPKPVPNSSYIEPENQDPLDKCRDPKPLRKSRCYSRRNFGTSLLNCDIESQDSRLPKKTQSNIEPVPPQYSSINNRQTERLSAGATNMDIESSVEGESVLAVASEVLAYEENINEYVHRAEQENHSSLDFMQFHNEIDENMRNILVNWIIEVHEKFRLRSETLFSCVNLIDKFLGLHHITKNRFQLLGITCLLISSKYEEIYVPELKQFVEICDNAYTAQELLEMESMILLVLKFNLGYYSPFSFVEQKANHLQLTPEELRYSEFLLHLCLVDYRMSRYRPSLLSIGSIYLAYKVLNPANNNPSMQQSQTYLYRKIGSAKLIQKYGLQENEFKECLRNMLRVYQMKDSHLCQAVKRKFRKRGIQ